ncbi:DUF378 domain-containing protein [Candidatus Woesearchaeota archaeon]|nr:DUF378 domain-containing protein [Candidatus Woesearchaeota archaeon]
MADKSVVGTIALWLVLIGSLNWGLVGAFNWNLVEVILGTVPVLVQIVYILMGLSALYMIYGAVKK